MKRIVISRIDDRLIHGQVATAWLKVANANTILIPDDKLVNDVFMQRILKSVTPAGINLVILKVDDAIRWFKEDSDEDVFIIAKTPFEFERMIDGGIEIKEIVLGNMAKNASRTPFIKQCSASKEEIACFKNLVDKGVNVYYQMVPGQTKQAVAEAI